MDAGTNAKPCGRTLQDDTGTRMISGGLKQACQTTDAAFYTLFDVQQAVPSRRALIQIHTLKRFNMDYFEFVRTYVTPSTIDDPELIRDLWCLQLIEEIHYEKGRSEFATLGKKHPADIFWDIREDVAARFVRIRFAAEMYTEEYGLDYKPCRLDPETGLLLYDETCYKVEHVDKRRLVLWDYRELPRGVVRRAHFTRVE